MRIVRAHPDLDQTEPGVGPSVEAVGTDISRPSGVRPEKTLLDRVDGPCVESVA